MFPTRGIYIKRERERDIGNRNPYSLADTVVWNCRRKNVAQKLARM